MNIYIYNLKKLDDISQKYDYINLPAEMRLFDLFLDQIKNNYNIVENICDASLAFIPIDFTKLLFSHDHLIFYKTPDNCPIKPPTFGSDYKKDYMKFFWDNYVEEYINMKSNIPHFILHSYVLFDIDFTIIPDNIYIVCYEKYVTENNNMITVNNGSNNRTIMIPYILNENKNYGQSKIIHYYYENVEITQILNNKLIDLAFFGSINKRTNMLYNSRKFLLDINLDKYTYIRGEGHMAEQNLSKIKYLFVLRGDTPTRLCFYQCFAFAVVPIIFEDELELYSNLLLPNNINIKDSVLVLPDISSENSYQKIEEILQYELSDNIKYINKIKNHKEIFNNFNYFNEPLSLPIKNVINYIVQ